MQHVVLLIKILNFDTTDNSINLSVLKQTIQFPLHNFKAFVHYEITPKSFLYRYLSLL